MILVIDDVQVVRDWIVRMLRQCELNVVGLSSAAEALDFAANNALTLVVLGTLDGSVDKKALIAKLRQGASGLKVMYISSSNSMETVTKALEWGADDCISKPFDFEILRIRLQLLGLL